LAAVFSPGQDLSTFLAGGHQPEGSVQTRGSHDPVPTVKLTGKGLHQLRIFPQSFGRFLEVEELHSLAVFLPCETDEVDHLVRLNPAMRVEDEREDALL